MTPIMRASTAAIGASGWGNSFVTGLLPIAIIVKGASFSDSSPGGSATPIGKTMQLSYGHPDGLMV